ncbi:MAG: plastoquinol terminal oxidase, partial [Synechococcus sp. YX04-3]
MPGSMRDVVEAIVRDEADHVKANSKKATAF